MPFHRRWADFQLVRNLFIRLRQADAGENPSFGSGESAYMRAHDLRNCVATITRLTALEMIARSFALLSVGYFFHICPDLLIHLAPAGSAEIFSALGLWLPWFIDTYIGKPLQGTGTGRLLFRLEQLPLESLARLSRLPKGRGRQE